jgi:hypothetical protein
MLPVIAKKLEYRRKRAAAQRTKVNTCSYATSKYVFKADWLVGISLARLKFCRAQCLSLAANRMNKSTSRFKKCM